VPRHASIGIHQQFTSGESGIGHGASQLECAGGVDEIVGGIFEIAIRDNGPDDMLDDIFTDFILADAAVVLAPMTTLSIRLICPS
jgi:hypothetical protein